MTQRDVETSPQTYARIGGILYLIIIVVGGVAEFSRGDLVVSGDATATAGKIMAAELQFRLGSAGELMMLVCAVALAMILYVLLRPVSKNLALLATFFGLVSIAIEGLSRVNLFAALFPLGSASYLKAFEPHQLDAMAYLSLRTYEYGFGISLVFFSFALFFYGFLVFRSGFYPKVLGLLMMIGAGCYLFNSVALFLAPEFESTIFPMIVLPAGLAELAFCLWLIVVGVDVAKWKERAAGQMGGAL